MEHHASNGQERPALVQHDPIRVPPAVQQLPNHCSMGTRPRYRVPPVTALAAMGNTNVILSVLVDP